MGEIADMMINGELCAYCGSNIDCVTAGGFPIVCNDCWNQLPKKDRKNVSKESDF